MTVKIKCAPYLIQFMNAIFGPMPIAFPKNHVLNYTLRHLLDRPPRTHKETNDYENYLEIQLPYSDETNVIYNFYLSDTSKRILENRIEREFRRTFRDDINASRLSGINRKDAIGLFIDKYELNPDVTDMLEKDYQRNSNLKYWHKKKAGRKKLKLKSSV